MIALEAILMNGDAAMSAIVKKIAFPTCPPLDHLFSQNSDFSESPPKAKVPVSDRGKKMSSNYDIIGLMKLRVRFDAGSGR